MHVKVSNMSAISLIFVPRRNGVSAPHLTRGATSIPFHWQMPWKQHCATSKVMLDMAMSLRVDTQVTALWSSQLPRTRSGRPETAPLWGHTGHICMSHGGPPATSRSSCRHGTESPPGHPNAWLSIHPSKWVFSAKIQHHRAKKCQTSAPCFNANHVTTNKITLVFHATSLNG